MKVVLVTRDRWRLFEQTLQSLYRHTPNGAFELVVIDDCSEDQQRVTDYQASYGYALIRNAEPTPLGQSKNNALSAIESGLVYLTDNDVYFKQLWLARMLFAWEKKDPKIKLLGGGCHEWLGTNRTDKYEWFEIHHKDAVSGWSWLLDIETWQQYGPLEGRALGSGKSEDWAFCQKIREDGYEVASVWPEVIIHCGRTNTEGQPATGSSTIRDYPGIVVE